MSAGIEAGHEHPAVTARSRYRYFFYDKHHGRGGRNASQWAREVIENEEFAIFDEADQLELGDRDGNLFGALRGQAGELRVIGTLGQQIAKFPVTRPSEAWHGYPLYPLTQASPSGPPIRAVPFEVLEKMVQVGVLNDQQFRRLRKGRHA